MPTVAAKDAVRGKSTLGSWVKAVCRAAEAAGCDSAALLEEPGVSLNTLQSPTALCPLAASLRLWQAAFAATQDPAFGVKVVSHIKQTTFHALSYSGAASSTLKEAFERSVSPAAPRQDRGFSKADAARTAPGHGANWPRPLMPPIVQAIVENCAKGSGGRHLFQL